MRGRPRGSSTIAAPESRPAPRPRAASACSGSAAAPPSAGTGTGSAPRAGHRPARSSSAARRGSGRSAPPPARAQRGGTRTRPRPAGRARGAAPRPATGTQAPSAGAPLRAPSRPAARASEARRARSPSRRRRRPRTVSCEQLLRPSARQPARGLARGSATVALEEHGAQPHRREQQPPGPFGLAGPAVLPEKPQVPAQLLAVHRPPVLGGRRAADMDELGAREEEYLPPRLPEAVAPVGLLAEHEVVLVEEPYGIGGLAADEHAGAHHELGLPHLVVPEPRRVERIQRARARRELAQEEVLGREAPEAREAADRTLQRAVRVQQLRADDGGFRVLLGERDEPLNRVADRPRVRVEQQEIVAVV